MIDVSELHRLIDEWAAKQPTISFTGTAPTIYATPPQRGEAVESKPEPPKDKRLVRTKSSGDRVYLLDEVKKTRQWITKPELVDALGFTMADVVDIDDAELFKYAMGAAIYRIDE